MIFLLAYSKPFEVRLTTDSEESSNDKLNRGYAIRYTQIPCWVTVMKKIVFVLAGLMPLLSFSRKNPCVQEYTLVIKVIVLLLILYC